MVTKQIRMSDVLRATLLIGGAIAQIVVSFFPQLFGIDATIGGRSAASNTPLVPAGIAFAIWAPLFLGSLLFAIAHALPALLRQRLVGRVGWLAAGAFWGNAVWAGYTPARGPDWISFALLEFILICLLAAIAQINRKRLFGAEWGVLFAPLFALAGWLTIASAAGLSVTANFTGFNPAGLEATQAALLVLGIWLLPAIGLVIWVRSLTYTVPILWGLCYIVVANLARENYTAASAAGVAVGVILIVAIVARFRR